LIVILMLALLVPGSGFSASAADWPLRRDLVVARYASKGGQVPGPELVDRTLALVGGQPITLSDARAALALGLVDSAPGSPSPMDDGLARLIQRELILREVQRYAPPAPSESAVDERLEKIRGRFPDAAAMNRVLDANGFTEARLRAWVRDDLRTEAYLVQRFASATAPADTEIAREYLQSKAAYDRKFATFEAAAAAIRQLLIESRRRQLVVDWLSDLERRTEIVLLDPR
jgi:hypothetical protein